MKAPWVGTIVSLIMSYAMVGLLWLLLGEAPAVYAIVAVSIASGFFIGRYWRRKPRKEER